MSLFGNPRQYPWVAIVEGHGILGRFKTEVEANEAAKDAVRSVEWELDYEVFEDRDGEQEKTYAE